VELKRKVESIEVKEKSISQLLAEMAKTAYQGRKLGEAVEVWEEMIKDPNVTIIMGLAGSMSTAGQWKMINWLIENRFIDVLVSTGANVSEDIVEAMGFSYWQGSHLVNDRELLKADINRYYDVYGFEKDYVAMENLIKEFVLTLREDYIYSSMEFLHLFGRWLLKRGVRSIVAVAAEHGVPVFCPAIADSAYGEAFIMAKNEGKTIIVDNVKDFDQFVSIGERVKDIGVIYIGGGVPKDYTQLLAISLTLKTMHREVPGRRGFMRKSLKEYYYPHKYAIQITTDSPQWGGLSGCTLEEAISWGKIDAEGKRVTCYCDATIALPLITHALNERIKFKRKPSDMSWLFSDVLKAHPNH
jgi:deoxyhypusine synthase